MPCYKNSKFHVGANQCGSAMLMMFILQTNIRLPTTFIPPPEAVEIFVPGGSIKRLACLAISS